MFLEDSWINCTIADDLHNCRLFARLQIFCTIAGYLQDCWLFVQMHICGAPMIEIHVQTIKLLIFNAKSRISLDFLVVVKLVLTIIGPSCPHIEFNGFHWFQYCMSVATNFPKLETFWWKNTIMIMRLWVWIRVATMSEPLFINLQTSVQGTPVDFGNFDSFQKRDSLSPIKILLRNL
jgi:hypothetical protein